MSRVENGGKAAKWGRRVPAAMGGLSRVPIPAEAVRSNVGLSITPPRRGAYPWFRSHIEAVAIDVGPPTWCEKAVTLVSEHHDWRERGRSSASSGVTSNC